VNGDRSPCNPRRALALLLFVNLFCYLDRYILASILPAIKAEFLAGDPDANGKAGLLTTAFLVSYMLTAPVFGWLADRFSRWVIIGCSVALWSLASGASGLAAGFVALLLTRVFLGIGEAGYGPAAPTIISDLYPVERRGAVMAWFFMAIPVGSALGYAFGGLIHAHLGWRWAFYLVTPPGLLLAALCFFMPEPRRASASAAAHPGLAEYKRLLKIPSLMTNIAAQTAMTFAIGGLSVWAPTYIHEARGLPLAQVDLIFGGILVVAGIISTLLGGWLGDKLRARFSGSYFLVSGCGMLLGFPCSIAMLYAPFPAAWIFIFLAMFFLFLNTGPSNTALANVTPSSMRATAFALNILVIHLLGDALSPPLIGWIKDHGSWNLAFFTVSTVMLLAGIIWIASMKSLARDTDAVSAEETAMTKLE
jgi:MFS family permease